MSSEQDIQTVILQYDMPDDHAKAYRIAMCYLEKAQKLFPNYKHYKLPKGDPRNSELFRHCYKLIRDNQLLFEDYELYVHAQLDILRHICGTDGSHPRISPTVLSGEKAWRRWLLWKRKYDKVKNFARSKEIVIDTQTEQKVKNDLQRTKDYFFVQFDRLDISDVRKSLESGEIFVWISWGKVSYHYLLLSPVARNWMNETKPNLLEKYSIDLSLYMAGITNTIEEYFKELFSHEFGAK